MSCNFPHRLISAHVTFILTGFMWQRKTLLLLLLLFALRKASYPPANLDLFEEIEPLTHISYYIISYESIATSVKKDCLAALLISVKPLTVSQGIF